MLTITVGGDSQSAHNAGYSVRPSDFWPSTLADLTGQRGVPAQARTFGVPGDTSTQLVARADVLQMYGTPDIGIIQIGVNDPGASISQATTQANIQALIKSLKFAAVGATSLPGSGFVVAGQGNLPTTGRRGDRYVVTADTSTTGGTAAWSPAHAATITGTAAGQTVWEFRYGLAGEAGWGRIATNTTTPTACKRIVVLSTNYLNYSTAGDTPTTPYAANTAVRAAQQAAVTAENVTVTGRPTVIYADLYTLQRGLITAGTIPDFSATGYDPTRSWHWTDLNQHHSLYGHQLAAQACDTAIAAAWPNLYS